MDEPPEKKPGHQGNGFSKAVNEKVKRRLKSQKRGNQSVWSGLGTSGLIGWSVVVPTLVGAVLGNWLDARYPGKHGWTLALMAGGLTIGCFNAWSWVVKEDQAMHDEQENHDE